MERLEQLKSAARRKKIQFLCAAWFIAAVASMIPDPNVIIFAGFFPLGLIQFAAKSGWWVPLVAGWLFYFGLTILTYLQNHRARYFICYGILCAGLILNVVGCHVMHNNDPLTQFVRHISQTMEDTKKQNKAADVQSVTIPFFLAYQRTFTNGTDEFERYVDFNKPPKEITSLPIFGEDPSNVQVWTTSNSNELLFVIGSGFGHWGI